MKNIRTSVFETNSSSTHSVSINSLSGGIYDTIAPDNGVINLNGGEFGWEWHQYNDSLTKANYAAIFSNNDEHLSDMLKKVIKEHTGAKEVVFNFSSDWSESGSEGKFSYIDHQSALSENGDAIKAFESERSLKDWIFNPKSWLFTGNDNEEAPPNFYDVEPDIKYQYQLSLEGSDLVCSFKTKPNQKELKDAIKSIIHRHPLSERSYNVYPNKGFEFIFYNRKTTDGKSINSFSKLKEKIIVLYKTEPYHTKKLRTYKGDKVKDSVDIKFTLKKIK